MALNKVCSKCINYMKREREIMPCLLFKRNHFAYTPDTKTPVKG